MPEKMFDFILNDLAGILQTLLLSLCVVIGQGVVVPDSAVVGRRLLYESLLRQEFNVVLRDVLICGVK